MIWYENLYLPKGWEKKKKRLIYKIEHNLSYVPFYLLALPRFENCVLEIIPTPQLRQKSYRTDDIRVVGIAKNKGEAMEMTKQIVMEVSKAGIDYDIASYFDHHNRDSSAGTVDANKVQSQC